MINKMIAIGWLCEGQKIAQVTGAGDTAALLVLTKLCIARTSL